MGERNGNKRDGGGGGGGGGGDRRGPPRAKKGRFQKHHAGGGPAHAVPLGARGLLVTCEAGRERRCGDEIAALCEGAFERLGTTPTPTDGGDRDKAAGGGDTVDARLAAEVAALRDPRKDRFRYYDTGVRGTFFLSFPSLYREPGAPGPVAVATELVERARREGRSGSRFAQRLVPVERSCFGGLEELAAMALDVAKEHFGAVLVEGEGEKKEEGDKKEEGEEAAAAAAAAAGGSGDGKAEEKKADEAKEGKAEAAPEKHKEEEGGKEEEEAGGAKKEDKEEQGQAAEAAGGEPKGEKGDGKPAAASPPPLPKRPRTAAQDGTKPLTFAVDVDSRACGRISRAAAIEVVAAPVPCPPHKVDLTQPQATIVVQCVRNAATASVVPRFRELLRLNLARAAQVGADEIEAREAAAAAAAAAGGAGAAGGKEQGGGKEEAEAAAAVE